MNENVMNIKIDSNSHQTKTNKIKMDQYLLLLLYTFLFSFSQILQDFLQSIDFSTVILVQHL